MLFVRPAPARFTVAMQRLSGKRLEGSKNFVGRSAKTRDELFFTHTKILAPTLRVATSYFLRGILQRCSSLLGRAGIAC